jgi:hypothetical protein
MLVSASRTFRINRTGQYGRTTPAPRWPIAVILSSSTHQHELAKSSSVQATERNVTYESLHTRRTSGHTTAGLSRLIHKSTPPHRACNEIRRNSFEIPCGPGKNTRVRKSRSSPLRPGRPIALSHGGCRAVSRRLRAHPRPADTLSSRHGLATPRRWANTPSRCAAMHI